MRGRWAPGGAGAEALSALQSCAPDSSGAAQPFGPLAVCQWDLSGLLGQRPRGRGLGSPWETALRLELRTIAPPPGSQSEAENTGAGRSELGWRVTRGARWTPERRPAPGGRCGWRDAGDAHSRVPSHQTLAAQPGETAARMARRAGAGHSEGALNKAASGGPGGLRLLLQ
ncbi:hypothetical protein NN561_013969 [Cricetulus griseus]